MHGAWTYYFLKGILACIAAMIVIFKYIKRGYLIKPGSRFFKDSGMNKWYFSKQKFIERIFISILSIFLVYLLVTFMYPLLKDYQLLKRNEYKTLIGITTTRSDSKKSEVQGRSVYIKSLVTQEEILIYFFDSAIYKDSYVVVNYLPNSRIGEIVKQQRLE